ncbi:glycoside hydrolase family 3 protein [Chishuiella changwenlii]|uniref:glycoside hydrolase family 3 protein n=1 Tax=Chishuiella changwenlii TaxID=1434701 RepID=UPI002FDA61C1
MRKNIGKISLILLSATVLVSWTKKNDDPGKQPVIKATSAKILTIDKLQFKDLNGNGKLDKYEDWRLAPNERSLDLLKQMTLEEKVGMLLISDTRMKNQWGWGGVQKKNTLPIEPTFNEEDEVSKFNMFTQEELQYPVMNAAGTTKGVTKFHLRHFILRTDTSTKNLAEWSNRLQTLSENTRLGIPSLVTSNPRNHLTSNVAAGTNVSGTSFTKWPTELGLAAMRDHNLVKKFAETARQEWTSVGIRKGYMYMADLSTEPRWQRTEGTFGEDPQLAADVIEQIVLGFQGDKLGGQSVAQTVKHFPGGGATQKGHDPHFSWGKFEVFPGNQLEQNLVPFKAAIKAGTSAIMPYYSVPKDTKYEEVAYAYNKAILRDLLRKELGYKGIINSDTGIIDQMPWGVEKLSAEQRYAKALEAGVNMFAGNANPELLLKGVKNGIIDKKYIDESVVLLLEEMFKLGIFENPYVDVEAAEKLVGNKDFQSLAEIAHRKSIVLLNNDKNSLPLKKSTKVYFENYFRKYSDDKNKTGDVQKLAKVNGLEFVSTPEEADVILLWIKPAIKPLFESTKEPLEINLSSCAVNVDYINSLTAKKPTILVMNYTNPFVIDEIYNDKTKNRFAGVLATFGTSNEALLDVISGKFNPTGKMPFTTPISNEAVINNREDLPGYKEGKDYGLFWFNDGMSYKK